MNVNMPIEIRRVANGFIAEAPNYQAATTYGDSERYVFQTMEALVGFVKDHFPPSPNQLVDPPNA